MDTVHETLQGLKPSRKETVWTPEQLAQARERQRRGLMNEIGNCSADCEICRGLGYVRNDVEIGEQGFGGIHLCPNADRWRGPGVKKRGLNRVQARTLTWRQVLPIGGSNRAVTVLRQTLARGHGWVYVYGGFGTGKTLALQTAVAESFRAGNEAAYVRMAEILDDLREAFQADSQISERGKLAWWSQLPVLAIDEFDKVRETEWGEERRFVLMDRRYEQAIRGETVTIIASNHGTSELPGYLSDRVRDGRFSVVKIAGGSMRPGMGAKD